ncbi:MAG: oligosaccharide flippase family protein [Burkholderiaceae bacterium]
MTDRILARTLEGAIWSAVGRVAQTALSLLSVAVIAQVLTPQTYGLFGAAMLLIALTEVITGGTLTQSLIQRKALDQQHIDATFWLNSLLSLAAAGFLVALATPLLALVNAPEALAALYCLAILTVLNGVAAVPQALLMRGMNFRRSMQIDTVSTALASLTGIGLALGGAGIWALILMESVRVAVRTFMLLTGTDWTITGVGSRKALRELLAFNLSSLATVSLARIEQLLPRMLVATLLGPQALGLWLLARRVLDETQRLSAVPLTAVTMTAIARLQDEPARVKRVVLGLYQASSLFPCRCMPG